MTSNLPEPPSRPERKKRITKHRTLVDGKPVRREKQRKVLMKILQRVGFLVLLKRVRKNAQGMREISPSMRKQWVCRCEGPITDDAGYTSICGREIIVPEMYLRRKTNPKEDCGCQGSTVKSRNNREYRIWLMIRERTRNPAHIAHAHYKKNGIDICEEWYDLETGFGKFYAEVGKRPSATHSIDRIDNKRGYEPGNMRWATSAQQRANQGDMVAGYLEKDIVAAGWTRREFTDYVSQGEAEELMIKLGKEAYLESIEEEDDDDDE